MTDNYSEHIEPYYSPVPYSVVLAAQRKRRGTQAERVIALDAVVEGTTVGTRNLNFSVIENGGFVVCRDDEYAATGEASDIPKMVEGLTDGVWVVTHLNTNDSMGETADEVAEAVARVVNIGRE